MVKFLLGAGVLLPALASKSAGPSKAKERLPLLATHIAGTAYYDIQNAAAELRPKVPLVLKRQPGNQYDERAIEVFSRGGVKLGYIPRRDNAAVAALMDAGKTAGAQVAAVSDLGWDVAMELHLLD